MLLTKDPGGPRGPIESEIDLASHLPVLCTALHNVYLLSFSLETEARMTKGPGLPLHYCV